MVLWLLGGRAYDAIHSMGFPWCIPVGGVWTGAVWNDGVQISRPGVDKVKLLGFQYGLLFGLRTFGCNILCYGWERGFEKPIQKDPFVKLDLAKNMASPPLMDVVGYMRRSALAIG